MTSFVFLSCGNDRRRPLSEAYSSGGKGLEGLVVPVEGAPGFRDAVGAAKCVFGVLSTIMVFGVSLVKSTVLWHSLKTTTY